MRMVAFALWSMGVASSLSAQPAPPLVQRSTSALWGLQQRVWSQGSAPRDLAGAQADAQLGLGRWAIHGRASWSGLPGEYDRERLETVRAGSGWLAVSWSAASLPGGMVLAPEAVVGGAAVLERTEDGLRAQLARRVTLGAGLRVSSTSWSASLYGGQHHALSGWAIGAKWSARIGGSASGEAGEIRAQGMAACDRASCVAETALAVRVR